MSSIVISSAMQDWASLREKWTNPRHGTPPGGESWREKGSQVAPAYGAANQVTLVTYTCQRGFQALVMACLFTYEGSMWTPGDGNIIVDLDVNRPVQLTPSVGRPIRGYGNVVTPLGSYEIDHLIHGGVMLYEGDILRLKVRTVAAVSVGAGNFVNGALAGWEWDLRRNQ